MTAIEEKQTGFGKGLYAVFETNMGEMVARLEDEKTPETVKNFVGLATGEKEYTDPKTGKKSNEPFYDGTVFHRIIKNFMVQGGDRLGQGTGGPGFRFKDEFHPSLKHTGPAFFPWPTRAPTRTEASFSSRWFPLRGSTIITPFSERS